MSKVYIEKFLEEIKDTEKSISNDATNELERKAEKFFEALYEKALFIHDSGTYATLIIAGGGPVYLDSFFQTKSALKMLLSFIDNEDSYFDIPESELVDMANYLKHVREEVFKSHTLFHDFFGRSPEGQDYVLCAIRNTEKMYCEDEVKKMISTFSYSIDSQIGYISSLLRDFKTDNHLTLYFGMGKAFMQSDLERILAEKSAEKAMLKMKNQIQQNFEESHLHLDLFKENGFKLFDYLMKNHLSAGSGSQSDIAFYYRRMEYDKLIHARQVPFKKFLDQFYPELVPIGKMKSFDDVRTEKREQAYRTAKSIIGLK